jgi:hypothetical protein
VRKILLIPTLDTVRRYLLQLPKSRTGLGPRIYSPNRTCIHLGDLRQIHISGTSGLLPSRHMLLPFFLLSVMPESKYWVILFLCMAAASLHVPKRLISFNRDLTNPHLTFSNLYRTGLLFYTAESKLIRSPKITIRTRIVHLSLLSSIELPP